VIERTLILTLLYTVCWTAAAIAQTPSPTPRVRVFLDCQFCDENFLRQEITFVDYVRRREDADVHVLVTRSDTGGGGRLWNVAFIGLGRFESVDEHLTYAAAGTNTADETRRGFARVFALGLVRYAAESPAAPRLGVTYEPPGEQSAAPINDPWNFWVFSASVNGEFRGEQASSGRSVEGSASANRTTADWKIDLDAWGEYEDNRYNLDEGDTYHAVSRRMNVGALVTRSLTPHWSAGLVSTVGSSTFQNYRFRGRLAPGIEWNLFAYPESSRRILTVLYSAGIQHFDYYEQTIYGRQQEMLWDHRLQTSLGLQQPWGSASSSVEFAQYLDALDKYRLSAHGRVDVRLFKGFSVDLSGDFSRRYDQIYLPKGNATAEEILIRQRELASNYEYEFEFGVSYSFGSIFNNIVNARFRNALDF
jgi:hypothetical protein